MKLVRDIQQRTYEELPGYYTVYGDNGVSIGVAVATGVDGYFWYFGDSKIDATDATDDELAKLTEVYGLPHVVPCRPEVPKLDVYEYPAKTLERQAGETAFKSTLSEATKDTAVKVR